MTGSVWLAFVEQGHGKSICAELSHLGLHW